MKSSNKKKTTTDIVEKVEAQHASEQDRYANKMNLVLTYAKVFKVGATWVENLIETVINMTRNGQL